MKVLLGELSVERNELDVQMNERRAQLLVLKKDIKKEEENLQGILGQITKHKMGMSQDLLGFVQIGKEHTKLSSSPHPNPISAFYFTSLELKHVLETLELEKNELEGLKLQHEQKVNELEKTQVAILEVRNASVADAETGRSLLVLSLG